MSIFVHIIIALLKYLYYQNKFSLKFIILTKNSIIVISPGQLVSKSNMFGDMGYNKRNMWIYDKLISLDEGKRFINDGNGLVRIKEAFKGKRKVRLINSTLDDCFKVILPIVIE